MICTELTNKAMKLADQAYREQCNRSGAAYVFQPYHLAEQMNTEKRCCIALLHDVLKDTAITKEKLEMEFPRDIVESVLLLTHDGNNDYYGYIKNICTKEDAAFVKLAELIRNISEDQLAGKSISTVGKDCWFIKHLKAIKIVSDYLNNAILVPACTDDRQMGSILKNFQLPERPIYIETDKDAMKYLTDEQYKVLKKKTIEEQTDCFKVLMIRKQEGALTGDYYKTSEMGLKRFMAGDSDKMLLLASRCIIGFLDINRKDNWEYCREMIAPVYIGKYEVCRRSRNWIDHSWDHMAGVVESLSYKLKWK